MFFVDTCNLQNELEPMNTSRRFFVVFALFLASASCISQDPRGIKVRTYSSDAEVRTGEPPPQVSCLQVINQTDSLSVTTWIPTVAGDDRITSGPNQWHTHTISKGTYARIPRRQLPVVIQGISASDVQYWGKEKVQVTPDMFHPAGDRLGACAVVEVTSGMLDQGRNR